MKSIVYIQMSNHQTKGIKCASCRTPKPPWVIITCSLLPKRALLQIRTLPSSLFLPSVPDTVHPDEPVPRHSHVEHKHVEERTLCKNLRTIKGLFGRLQLTESHSPQGEKAAESALEHGICCFFVCLFVIKHLMSSDFLCRLSRLSFHRWSRESTGTLWQLLDHLAFLQQVVWRSVNYRA